VKFFLVYLFALILTTPAIAMDVESYKFKQYGAVDTTLTNSFNTRFSDFHWACQKKPTDYGYILTPKFTPCSNEYTEKLLAQKMNKFLGSPHLEISNAKLIQVVNKTLSVAKLSATNEFMRRGKAVKFKDLNNRLSELVDRQLLKPNQVHNFIMLDNKFNFASKYTANKDLFSKHRLIAKDYPAVQYAGEFIYVVDRNNNFVEFRISSSSGTFRPHCIEASYEENDDAAKKFLIDNFTDLNNKNIKTYCYSSDTNPSDGINNAYNSTETQKGRFVKVLERYTDYIGGDIYFETQQLK
jgi:hypothetical protein